MSIPEIFKSSDNSGNLSMTIKGLLIGIIPLAILLAKTFGISLAETDLTEFINAGAIAATAFVTFVGLGRKIYYKRKGNGQEL